MRKPLVALIGRPNVGTSTFFNTICGRRISIVKDMPGVTRDRIYGDAEWCGYAFSIVDTGGLDIKNKDEFEELIDILLSSNTEIGGGGDAPHTHKTIDSGSSVELNNLKKARTNVKNTINAINKEIKLLKNHAETGKMATMYLNQTVKRLQKIEKEIDSEVTTLTNGVTKAQKEEWKRFRELLLKWEAAQKNA